MRESTTDDGDLPIIVQKYGGSSVADIDKLRRVARKIVATRESGRQVVAVVSAMGNTTDELLERARKLNPEPNRRELDMLLSVGERISMALLSMGVHALGHEAISFTGSQVGIITNDAHSNARIIDVRPFRIQDELARDRIVIVAGYQGTSYKREVTTLGRGGSDMTAVALAGALGAEACEIYSDVDGVYTSDPRVVIDAGRLDTITADEMLELARHGARVLHADAVAWARRHRIALHARSTHAARSVGTVVRPDGWPDHALRASRIAPRGVASLERVLWVRGPGAASDAALTAVDEHCAGATILRARTAPTLDVVVDTTNCAGDFDTVAERMAEALSELDGLDVVTDHGSVTMVGQDIGLDLRWLERAREHAAEAGITPTSVEASRHTITLLVQSDERTRAMKTLHALVEPLEPTSSAGSDAR